MKRPVSAKIIGCLAVWTAVTTILVAVIGAFGAPPNTRAVILMGATLAVVWIGFFGTLMWVNRDRVRSLVSRVPGPWQVKFVVFCTLLALIEEAITTTLTNLAPLYGVPYGKAYITASGNYLDVVCLHSVVVFVPMFVCWAWLLSRFDFSPNTVLLLFGVTGTLAELTFGGVTALAMFGFWTFVYGLMIYLPVYSLPPDRPVKPARWKHGVLAVFLPFLFVIPVAGVIAPIHPVKIHFPPIQPGT
jgi:hypothetical protein